MCLYINLCVYVLCINLCVYVLCIYLCVYVYDYGFIYVYMYLCVWLCVHVLYIYFMRICQYVNMPYFRFSFRNIEFLRYSVSA